MQKNKLIIGLVSILGLLFSLSTFGKDIKAFTQEMVQAHAFDDKALTKLLNQATVQPDILTAMARPAEKKPWHQYQAIFLTPKRVADGIAFWQQNEAVLAKAQKEYGIPAEIIVAIIGVETFYGKNTGKYSVLDALVTLGFHYPPRSDFFQSELKEFLLLTRDTKWDPTSIKGSYAGAMGAPQFIPSSYRRYAVGDLVHNMDDAINSVANYFKVHGWQSEKPVIEPATVTGDKFTAFIADKRNPKPEHSLKAFKKMGVNPINANAKKSLKTIPLALVSLEEEKGPEYWLAAENFYVITRYNHSNHYAMAVYLLSEQVKHAYQQSNH